MNIKTKKKKNSRSASFRFDFADDCHVVRNVSSVVKRQCLTLTADVPHDQKSRIIPGVNPIHKNGSKPKLVKPTWKKTKTS